ncbi:MAG: efflux RND transporter periplasmic adaptor subunit [Methylophilaceae bacterium]
MSILIKRPIGLLPAILAVLLFTACSKKQETVAPVAHPVALVTVTQSASKTLEITEETVGSMESLVNPGMGAEVSGKVLQVLAHAGQTVKRGQLIAVLDATDYELQKREAQAEIGRIEALLANQGRMVERNQKLVQKNFISQNALDTTTTEQNALLEQLEGARAHMATVAHNSSKTRVFSPIDGRVEKQLVSPGDFVKQGDALFELIGTQKLRAHLPFPEGVAAKLHSGQAVRLTTPTLPDKVFNSVIKEIKPLIGESRSADVIVDVINQTGWQGGASVNGTVVLGEHKDAVVVPEASVVLRPAGEVVYVIQNSLASQRIVKVGLRQEGLVEITAGLKAGETVAVDGAAYLTDKAKVKLQ